MTSEPLKSEPLKSEPLGGPPADDGQSTTALAAGPAEGEAIPPQQAVRSELVPLAWLPSSRAILHITLGLGALALFLRGYALDDSLHWDSPKWFDRTDRFWAALSRGEFSNTFLAPHPGVTYMWLQGFFVKLLGASAAEINHALVLAAKLPVVMLGTLAATMTFPMLVAILGRGSWILAALASVLWITDPRLVAQSRTAHLDMIALSFTWLGLLTLGLAYRRGRWQLAIAAGLLFALGCLTKFAMVPIPGTAMLLLGLGSVLTRFRDRRGIVVSAIAGVSLLVGVFAFWPALWLHPIETMSSVVQWTDKVAGKARGDIGFYVGFIANSTPHESGLPALLGLILLVRRVGRPWPLAWLLLSFVPYLVIVALAPKKLARYLMPLIPVIVVLSAIGLSWVHDRARQRWGSTVALTALALLTLFRTERVAASLPQVAFCASWPTAPPCKLSTSNEAVRIALQETFYKEMADAIVADWRASGHRKKRPRVFCETVKELSRFMRVKPVGRRGQADYVIEWDPHYYPPIHRAKVREIAKIGKPVHVVREGNQLVGAAFRGAQFQLVE